MHRYDSQLRGIAFAYAALAGFVDAVGFQISGGLFVSFMTGNSTRFAVGVARPGVGALAAFAVIAIFVAGVVLGRLVSEAAGARRKTVAAAGVALFLLLAALLQTSGSALATIASLCFAMGVANTIFVRDGDVTIGVTYMTGTLVRFGYRAAEALRGGEPFDWVPYLGLWLSLVSGGIVGALLFEHRPSGSLWPAAGTALLLAFVVARRRRA